MENLDKLKLLAEALLEYETIDGADIDTIFAGERLERKPPVVLGERASSTPRRPRRRRAQHLRAAPARAGQSLT